MRKIEYTGAFHKDIKIIKKRGKDLKKLETLMRLIIENSPLSEKYKTPPLKGDYNDYMDSHIEPDWLLIYRIENDRVVFTRTGTHSDLF
jgi:mRNA interferase YafQ